MLHLRDIDPRFAAIGLALVVVPRGKKPILLEYLLEEFQAVNNPGYGSRTSPPPEVQLLLFACFVLIVWGFELDFEHPTSETAIDIRSARLPSVA